MQAYGGVLGIAATCKNAVGIIESGPAAGIVGTRFLGEHIGEKNILATDMGGTTFKVSVVRDGVIERDYKPVILRHSILSTKIWVESIGAGGGSIAWIDPDTGLLKVGPRAPVRRRDRSATMSAAQSRQFPMLTWCWVISTRIIFSAAG